MCRQIWQDSNNKIAGFFVVFCRISLIRSFSVGLERINKGHSLIVIFQASLTLILNRTLYYLLLLWVVHWSAPRWISLPSAVFNCWISGGDGKGKFTTFSMPSDFIWSNNSSTGRLRISGTVHPSNSSLNTAEEYNLKEKGIRNIVGRCLHNNYPFHGLWITSRNG